MEGESIAITVTDPEDSTDNPFDNPLDPSENLTNGQENEQEQTSNEGEQATTQDVGLSEDAQSLKEELDKIIVITPEPEEP